MFPSSPLFPAFSHTIYMENNFEKFSWLKFSTFLTRIVKRKNSGECGEPIENTRFLRGTYRGTTGELRGSKGG